MHSTTQIPPSPTGAPLYRRVPRRRLGLAARFALVAAAITGGATLGSMFIGPTSAASASSTTAPSQPDTTSSSSSDKSTSGASSDSGGGSTSSRPNVGVPVMIGAGVLVAIAIGWWLRPGRTSSTTSDGGGSGYSEQLDTQPPDVVGETVGDRAATPPDPTSPPS